MQNSLFTSSEEIRLTEIRAKLASELGLSPLKVWSAKAMTALLSSRPNTLAELKQVKGFPKKSADKFGPAIVAVFSSGQAEYATHDPEGSTAPEEPREPIMPVGEYIDYLNVALKSLADIKVIGEISAFKVHTTGIYMTLKDAGGDGVLECYINPYTYRGLGLPLQEGMKIIIGGAPTIFRRRGSLSFRVETVELSGEGTLKKAYDLLKQKLTEEGIFDRKRELPEFIGKVGIITSKSGAVIDDFRHNLLQLGIKLNLIDCRVEGKQSAPQIIRALRTFNNEMPELDCIVVMRGGGSLEDMQAFNSEEVVKEVFASRIPVIAAIGHDRDVPLTCLAADTFTSTPTAAAVLINNSWTKLIHGLPNYQQNILNGLQVAIQTSKAKVSSFGHRIAGGFSKILMRFNFHSSQVSAHLKTLESKLVHTSQEVRFISTSLAQSMQDLLTQTKDRISGIEKILAAASPERSLKLGYSISYNSAGKIIRSTKQVSTGEKLDIRLSDGTIKAETL